MGSSRILIITLALILFSCEPSSSSISPSWEEVESARARARQPDARIDTQQSYIDTLAAYLQANPDDARAAAVYRIEELRYARGLVARGRYAAAVPYFESAILSSLNDQEALSEELREVQSRIVVTRESFEQLSKGMSHDEVREIIGEPRPGWKHTIEKSGVVLETWYYKRGDGGVASVSFRDGKAVLIEHGTILD